MQKINLGLLSLISAVVTIFTGTTSWLSFYNQGILWSFFNQDVYEHIFNQLSLVFVLAFIVTLFLSLFSFYFEKESLRKVKLAKIGIIGVLLFSSLVGIYIIYIL